MSLKETLSINLELLGVSQALKEINRIKSETEDLQSAADKIKIRIDSHNAIKNKEEVAARIQARKVALGSASQVKAVADPLGAKYLGKPQYTNSETYKRIEARRNNLQGIKQISEPNIEVPGTKSVSEIQNIQETKKVPEPTNIIPNTRIFRAPKDYNAIAKAKFEAENEPYQDLRSFGNYAASIKQPEPKQRINPYQELRSFGDYASTILPNKPREIDPGKVLKSYKLKLNSATSVEESQKFANQIIKIQDTFNNQWLANDRKAKAEALAENRKYIQKYKASIEESNKSIIELRSSLNNYYEDKGNKPIFAKYNAIKNELNSIPKETANTPNPEFLQYRKAQLTSELGNFVDQNPVITKTNDIQKQLDSYYQAVRRNQARINKTVESSATQRQKIERNAYEAVNRFSVEAENLTEKEERQKTKIIEAENARRVKSTSESVGDAQKYFQTGFSMHIIQMYAMPLINTIKYLATESLKAFAEFDKKYTDYIVKSADYADNLSRKDFYNEAKGTTFGLSNAASTAERFAASGIDVAKSQDALTSTMQVAAIANTDYKETAQGVIQTLQSMHMQIGQTTQVTDAMINSANASSAELSDLVQWFEYSASAAYQLGINVKNLSAYLGILSSTGTPGAGAAARQLFLQLQKSGVQKKFLGKYSFLDKSDFQNFDKFIGKMRDYARASGDEKAKTTEATQILEGKANAQLALNNLMMAEPELWNRVMQAVQKSGTTQDLYNKTTNNTADALAKVATNIEILRVQFGSVFAIVANVLATITTAIVNITTNMPDGLKLLISIIIAGTGVLLIFGTALIGVIGSMAVAAGATLFLRNNTVNLNITTENLIRVFAELWTEIKKITIDNYSLAGSFDTVGGSMKTINSSVIVGVGAISKWQGVMTALSGGLIGYTIASAAMQKQMYAEAEIVNFLTAAYIGLQTIRTIPNIAGVVLGVGLAAGYEAIMYEKLENIKRQDRSSRIDAQTGFNQQTTKNYNINVANAVVSSDGMGFDDFADQIGGTYDE